ncbi:MAG: cupin domain-containing protein [Mycobacteriaceae bacterium]|nr:cupin domain-containing protein [Mycobacteriaceae bacterium]
MAIRYLVAALALAVSFAAVAHADEPGANEPGDPAGAGIVRSVFDRAITNIPGKSLVAQEVSYAPGAKDAPHRHPQSAFIMAYVIYGAIRSQVEGEPSRIYRAGETWLEDPGAHHVLAENASTIKPARFLAVFVVDSTDQDSLITFDTNLGDSHE